jgi:predicted dehydrogenase
VAVVGCGQIADAHVREARRTGLACVVAVCDREPDLAHQAAVRWGIPGEYDDVARMLRIEAPDVVHVATPPATHRELLLRSLHAGAHVYVEKPFALTRHETDDMLAAAESARRIVCVGHDRLFEPTWLEMRQRIESGAIGNVTHVEITQLYDLAGPFGRMLVNEPHHWVRELPGGLFHNTLPHALSAVAELVRDADPAVTAVTWAADPKGIQTNLHMIVRGSRVTASVTFLTTAGPPGTYMRVHGTAGWLESDYEARTVDCRSASGLPSLLVKFAVPLRHSREMTAALARNVRRFAHADLHYFAGMQALFRAFYSAVLDSSASPIDPDHIRRVAGLLDHIAMADGGVDARFRGPVLQALQL